MSEEIRSQHQLLKVLFDNYSGETTIPSSTQEEVPKEFPEVDVFSKDDIQKAKMFLRFMGADVNYKVEDMVIFKEYSYLCSQHPAKIEEFDLKWELSQLGVDGRKTARMGIENMKALLESIRQGGEILVVKSKKVKAVSIDEPNIEDLLAVNPEIESDTTA